jgi:hypothetical protein
MRTTRELKRKIKDLRYRGLQKVYKKSLSKRPENCKHNFRQQLKHGETIGLCMPNGVLVNANKQEEEWQGTICDAVEDAEKCTRFELAKTKKMLAQEFDAELRDPEIRSEKHKAIHALLWVLEEDTAGLVKRIFRFCIPWLR